MKWLKIGALVVAALLLLAIGAVAVLVATFDANRYKGIAIDWMRDNKQRTLAIDGPVSLSVFPRLALKLEKVTLSEHRRPQPFARFDEAALAVDLLPLLRKQVVVDRVGLRGAELRYTRDAQGRRNIDDLLQQGPPAAAGKPAGAAPQFDIAAVELRDVKLALDDQPAGVRGDVTLRSLTIGRLVSGRETPLDLDALLALQRPALKGELRGKTRLSLDVDKGAFALRDAALGYKGTVGTMRLDDGSVKLERFAFEPQAKRISLEQLALALKAESAGRPLGAQLSWPRLDVADQSLQGSALQGELSLGGREPMAIKFKSGAPSGTFDRIRLPALEATFSAGGARKVSGLATADVSLQPARRAVVLDPIDAKVRLEEQGAVPFAVALKGRADASAEAASWQLAGALNDNAFDSRGSASFAGAVPNIKAEGRFATLDLDRLRPKAGAASAPATGADTPVDLSALDKVQGSLSLRAARLVSRPYTLDDARVGATLERGVLRVDTLAGRIWGGSFDGRASADARNRRLAIAGVAQGIDVRAALRDIAGKDLLEGNGRFTVDLASTGKSVNELKSRLDGKAALNLRDGAIKGINLARTLREAKAALAMKRDALQKAGTAEKTDFSELSATFTVRDGVARSNDLDVKSPFLRLGGDGAIDIGRNRIDYTLRATVTETSKGQGGDELAALRGLTVPVALSGPLDAPSWQVQWSAVAQAAVQQRLEDKLKDKLGLGRSAGAASAPRDAPKDKLKEALRGLLR